MGDLMDMPIILDNTGDILTLRLTPEDQARAQNESVVEPNQKQYPWYHRQYRRVPTIDQCYADDPVCDYEANQQFKRDRAVDSEILNILRQRYEDCMMHEQPDHLTICKPFWDNYKLAEEAWFIKYGDLGAYGDARKAYMKQKHRMIWERRNGPLSELTAPKSQSCH